MMKTVRLLPYKPESESAKVLAQSLGLLRLKSEGSKFIHGPNKLILNWGSSKLPDNGNKSRWLNHPELVSVYTNKKTFFDFISERTKGLDHPIIPRYVTSYDEALRFLSENPKSMLFARTVLTGHSGVGITKMTSDNPDSFVKANLYTEYIPKIDEFRVHICNKKVFLVQRKALLKDRPANIDTQIRNLANGFIFQRNDVVVPEAVLSCVNTFIGLEPTLDFYCLDLIYNQKRDKAYILEANTAPGLSGSTIEDYTRVLSELIKSRLSLG